MPDTPPQDALFVCTRRVEASKFIAVPDRTRFLCIPSGASEPLPEHEVSDRAVWLNTAIAQSLSGAKIDADPNTGDPPGNQLIFVHGFNNSAGEVLLRHRAMQKTLNEAGYTGGIISFDWPSNRCVLNYYPDRIFAKLTAQALVTDCISVLISAQSTGCTTNVHLLCHSTGAYVVREAFDDAEDRPAFSSRDWTVSQVCLIAGDISSASMSEGDSKSAALFRRAIRITNYFNPFDGALKLSNMKRAGVAPRVGRIGLPPDSPSKCVDVDCGAHFRTLADPGLLAEIPFTHAWYFSDSHFARDLVETLRGDTDRERIPTRVLRQSGELELIVKDVSVTLAQS